jgi:hypothetical protein
VGASGDPATPAGVLLGDPVVVTATVDDSRYNTTNGSEPVQSITAAELSLDAPPWIVPITAVAMTAVDGSFNQPIEQVTATIDTTTLTTGRHIAYLRGQDASGRWGPVSAVFLHLLDPDTAPVIEGLVTETVSGAPLAAVVAAGPFQTSSDPVTGLYQLLVPEGIHEVIAEAPGHGRGSATGVVAQPSQTTTLDLELAPSCALLADDVESGNRGWTAQAPWAIASDAVHSGTAAWSDSPGGVYSSNRNISLTSPTWNLSSMSGVTLSFWHRYDLEDGWDYGYVEYTTNGTSWVTAATVNGEGQTTWRRMELALPALDGQAQAAVRFRLRTDGSVVADGWHIDDIALIGSGPDCPGVTCGLATPVTAPLPFLATASTSGHLDIFDPDLCNGAIPAGAGRGPEVTYWVRVDATCALDLTVDPVAADLTLYVVSPDCSDVEGQCLALAETGSAGQPETVSFVALAGTDYYVVVDGNNGAAGAFDLTISGNGCSLVPVELERFTIE